MARWWGPHEDEFHVKHRDGNTFDVIVIGAGHAGCEAALAAARMGREVLVLALNVDRIAHMPCNPSIGGIGKGQLVREVDALGGQMGRTIDRAMVQIKVLNSSKGPAVQALRAQADKRLYSFLMKAELLGQPGLTLRQAEALSIAEAGETRLIVKTAAGDSYSARAVVVTTGTFLKGRTTIGQKSCPGGRMGEAAGTNLSSSLLAIGLDLGRFQSATPPRVLAQSCNPDRMREEPGVFEPLTFSFASRKRIRRKQRACWLTHTNKATHRVIEQNIHLSPIRSGSVSAKGPRYCPSIDRKVINFPDRDQHPVFVEPEGWRSNEYYLQGLTTSMPVEIQEKIINTVPGLEKARIVRPGYAVAYDYLVSGQLSSSLETLPVPGLFTAGQINGTSGYEEAAAQGLIAGINAARLCVDEAPLVLGRSQAYIGVLVDDLVTKEIDEPYRMFTSRAEHRLVLRSDNADLRLTPTGHKIGLAGPERLARVERKRKHIDRCLRRLESTRIKERELRALGTQGLVDQAILAKDLLKRPEINIEQLKTIVAIGAVPREARLEAEIEVKYEGYIRRQLALIAAQRRQEDAALPDIEYASLKALSHEARVKLDKFRPHTLGQAGRLAGVTPADIAVLVVHVEQLRGLAATKKTDVFREPQE